MGTCNVIGDRARPHFADRECCRRHSLFATGIGPLFRLQCFYRRHVEGVASVCEVPSRLPNPLCPRDNFISVNAEAVCARDNFISAFSESTLFEGQFRFGKCGGGLRKGQFHFGVFRSHFVRGTISFRQMRRRFAQGELPPSRSR